MTRATPELTRTELNTGVPVRVIIAGVVAAAVIGLVAVKFLLMLKPSAERARVASCLSLDPSNPRAFDELPQPAIDFTAQAHDGKDVALSAFRGKVVFLNFWATWCPPCKDEMPDLEALQRELGDEGLVVVGVASEPSWDSIRTFFPGGTPMTVLLDPPTDDGQIGNVTKAYMVPKLPETFLIDRAGRVRYYYVNKRNWTSRTAVECIRTLLDE